MDQHGEILLGKLALQLGYLTQDHLDNLLREQAGGCDRTLGQLLVERHFVTPKELADLQALQVKNLAKPSDYSAAPRGATMLGAEALRRGWLTAEQLADALRVQGMLEAKGDVKRLGEVLYARGYLTRDQVKELLGGQGKRLARCPGCAAQYNLVGMDLARRVECPKCGGVLQTGHASERIDADGSFIGHVSQFADGGAGAPPPPLPSPATAPEPAPSPVTWSPPPLPAPEAVPWSPPPLPEPPPVAWSPPPLPSAPPFA
ncbi:MAG: hypothetical protein HZA54_07280, partial [Planctomycetes bacterium]|nr:hypothetical protein [Planctomycetota bacterium]